MLSEMLTLGVTHCVMEVSSHALDQDRVEGIIFDCGIFTNLTQDHLDYHRSMEEYFRAKCRLFKKLDSSACAIINNDDEYGRIIKELTPAKVVTYGIETASDLEATDIRFDLSGTRFALRSFQGRADLKTRLIGMYNVYNILAGISWAMKEGIDLNVIKSAVEEFYSVPGRLERIDFKGEFAVFVDYAHTEDALRNVIKALRGVFKSQNGNPSGGRIVVVFGCGGERDKTKRPNMGRVVSELADYAIITSDNPRSENPAAIIEDIKRGIKKDNYCVVIDRREAIRKSFSCANRGDILLVAGKGHEDYQVFKDRIIHFDDREIARECLTEARAGEAAEKIDA
jgi:UDP-N-acetylmuramoyl-L-alanyl-D-glutamate--2,6-diaminopimelate ligase